ncbi:MAG: DedA family protein [Thermoguttaceae bacterium]|jgi:membrane protein DedA with SNARE-associated domain|nr:DedA family protein [Thermoguttaceae bacterium]
MPDPLIHGPLLAYLGIVFFLAMTGAGMPIPEEIFVVGAAVAAAGGTLDPWVALVACMVGVLLGDSLMYFLGARFGRGLLNEHRWFARMLTPEAEARIERLIQHHGMKMFLVARFLVGLRAPFYITSGILRIGYRRFLLLDFLCTCINIGAFFGLAFFLSEYYGEAIYQWIRDAEWFVTGLVLLAALVAATYYYVRRRRRRSATVEPCDEAFDSLPIQPPEYTPLTGDGIEAEPLCETGELERVA